MEKIYKEPETRAELARRSHFWFHNIFLSKFVAYKTAPFQKEMFSITEDPSIKLAVITAFRGSGKSTIVTLSHSIWAVVGIQQKKFVLILTKTRDQAKNHFANLKREFETNELLRADLGPFEIQSEEWGQYSIVLPKYGARITAASSEQSIRGLRHGAHRPDLVIVDDPDDLQSIKTLEGRDKTWVWFTGEVIPIGDQNTKIIVVGNLLHDDSVMARLKAGIQNKVLNGTYREYPIVDENNVIAWPGKFPNMEAIENLRKSTGDEAAFQREYLLKIITSDDQVIKPEWIQYYDELPKSDDPKLRYVLTGIDLAISEKESADCTAMVSARVYGYEQNLKIFILPNPINERLNFPATVEKATELSKSLGDGQQLTKLVIENVGYQKAIIDHLRDLGYPVEEFKPQGADKHERLSSISHLIQQGKVFFPKDTCRPLTQQLLGFGKERHDDLVDALTIVLHYVMADRRATYTIPSIIGSFIGPSGGPKNEKEADQAQAAEQEYARSSFSRTMRETVRHYRGW